jgi:hypothetical protein
MTGDESMCVIVSLGDKKLNSSDNVRFGGGRVPEIRISITTSVRFFFSAFTAYLVNDL